MAAKKAETSETTVVIAPPNLQYVQFTIEGITPYVQNKFPAKAAEEMRRKQEAGSKAKSKNQREAKDFHEAYLNSLHVSHDGWYGIPAPAFRNAMISACRLAGFVMTRAKLAINVEAQGMDKDDGSPLVRITKGEPEYSQDHVRLETGVADIRPRGRWAEGWQAEITIQFDADQFGPDDVCNLLIRAGQQVGVGEGRPDSKKSNGQGWGRFKVLNG